MIDEEEIFHAAAALPADERTTFLDAACSGLPELRARVGGLLEFHDDPDLLRHPVERAVLPDGAELVARMKPEQTGERIGAYKLLQEIGVGGFGVVWMAEQERPVRRRVALKIIKLGMDTKEVIARFEQERQALAMMDHPNIAKVFDAGATQFGRPYFVMELVHGIKITDYCEQANLPIADRLALFISVCQAVQHAHQKGIIHRDLKPSNILVTLNDGAPVPKVIDFGVAKATQSVRLTDLTLFTQFEQMIGTPLYMSPEQAEMSGLDIDTRSDIYSLGVLLYELLTGRTPFDPEQLMRQGLDEIRRAIREREPLAPSAMLRQIEGPKGAKRHNEVGRERHLRTGQRIPADLDWIAMKALEKDRARRYQTANDLAGDVRRHLAGDPIQARPVSPFYRLQRLVRRNQLACTAGAILCGALLVGFHFSEWAFVIALLAGLAFSLAAFFNEQAQRRVAERERHGADEQRQLARDNELSALRRGYVSDVQLAHQSMLAHQFGRARRLLDEHRPRRPGEVDLRGWEWRWLWQELRGEARRVVAKHPARAGSVAFSADGRRIAVGWSDGRVEVSAATGKAPTRVFSMHGGSARVAFPPKGDALVFTTGGGVVMRHDFTTDRETELCRAPSEIHDLSFSRGGEWLVLLTRTTGDRTPWPDSTPRPRASGGGMAEGSFEPETVLVVDAADGRILHTIDVPPGSGEFFNHARISPDGARLHVTCGAFREPRLLCLRVTDGAQLWEAAAPTDAGGRKVTGFSAMDLSPNGRLLATATGYDQRTIQIWNAETGECLRTLEGHRDYVMGLAFSSDGRVLGSASSDETVRLWNTATWNEAAPPLCGNGDEVDAVAFSPDGLQLVTGSKDGLALLWEPAARRPPGGRFPLPAATKFAFMIPGGRFAFALTAENRRLYIETATDRETPLALTISRQGFYGGPNFVGYPDPENGHAFTLYEMVDVGAKRIGCVPLGRPAGDWFAYSPQRRSLAWTEPGTTTIRVTDVGPPHAEIELVSNGEICLPASFDLSGQYLLGVGPAGDARVWDLNTRQRITAAEDYFSPFGMIVFGNLRNALGTPSIRAWVSAAVRATPHRLTRSDPAPPGFWPPGAVTSRAYSPDGRTTAVATENGSVVLFDAARQEKIATLHGRAHAIFALAFTPDGARLLSANDAIWDVATGQELVTLTAKGALHSIAQFSDDGDTLLVGSWHGPGEYQYWRAPSFEEIAVIERDGGGWPRGEE